MGLGMVKVEHRGWGVDSFSGQGGGPRRTWEPRISLKVRGLILSCTRFSFLGGLGSGLNLP